MVYAVLWTFGTVLNEQARRDLDQRLKAKIDPLKTDFTSFQKWKKKQATEAASPFHVSSDDPKDL